MEPVTSGAEALKPGAAVLRQRRRWTSRTCTRHPPI